MPPPAGLGFLAAGSSPADSTAAALNVIFSPVLVAIAGASRVCPGPARVRSNRPGLPHSHPVVVMGHANANFIKDTFTSERHAWTPRGWRTLQRESREASRESLVRRWRSCKKGAGPGRLRAGVVAAVFAALKVIDGRAGARRGPAAAYRRCNRCGKRACR